MRKHNGMRPQDIVVLMQIILSSESLSNKELAQKLYISSSEIGESLNRSLEAGLLSEKKKVHRLAFMEFLQHGFRYVFPIKPHGMSNGIPTAHSHPFIKKDINSQLSYVWPDFKGNGYGLSIEPLYKEQIKAVVQNPDLYKALALLDILRVGRNREIQLALEELKKIAAHDQSPGKHIADQSSK